MPMGLCTRKRYIIHTRVHILIGKVFHVDGSGVLEAKVHSETEDVLRFWEEGFWTCRFRKCIEMSCEVHDGAKAFRKKDL